MKKFCKLLPFLSLILTFGCSTHSKRDEFVISRTFDADAKKVYEMWTNPKLYTKWMGPTGAKMSFVKTNVKEVQSSQWKMTTSDGNTKYGMLNYQTIHPPHQFVYTQNFCDKDGKFAKLPINIPYPDVLLMTATLEAESPKKTKMTVKWTIHGEATEAQRKTFNEMNPVMTTGWNQSFDKLEELLLTVK